MEILAAFIGGLLSFASPCFFPLIPAYLSMIAGVSLREHQNLGKTLLIHSIVFVLGFSLSFSFLGASAAIIGKAIKTYKGEFMFVAGVLLTILGLNTLGIVKIPIFLRGKSFDISRLRVRGLLFPFIFGIFFAISWTPCIGPILAGILLIASSYSAKYGSFLLVIYSLGIGLPFIIATLFLSRFLELSRRFKRFMKAVEFSTGLILVIMGITFSTNRLDLLSVSIINPNRIEERVAKLSGRDRQDKPQKDASEVFWELYSAIFSGRYEPVNHILPSESRFVVISFWWPKCEICLRNLSELTIAQAKYGISVIGIAFGQRRDIMDFLLREYELNFPVFLISDIMRHNLYTPGGLPETLFFYDGKFVGRRRGVVDESTVQDFLNMDFSALK